MAPRLSNKRFIYLGLATAASLGSVAAHAQDGPGSRIVLEAPEPAPPAATTPAAPDAVPAPAPAAAPSSAPEVEPAPAEETPGQGKGKNKNKNKKHKHDQYGPRARDSAAFANADPDLGGVVFNSSGGSLQVKGRVFALAELSHRSETVFNGTGLSSRDVNALDLSLASARFGLEYHSPLPWLSAELELDIAGKPQVKDAYIQAGKRFYVKAGQFKVPSAALELESPWTLPLVRRGLVHDLLSDWLDVAGRRPGLLVGFRCKCELKPGLMFGAFQGTTLDALAPGNRDVRLIEKAALDAQTLAARGELKVAGVELGAWYEHRVGSKEVGEFSHFATFGLDATLDHTFETSGLRFWVDGGGGKSLYVNDDKPGPAGDPLFLVGRALLGYRFGGVVLGDPYVEPFGFFALLDPDTEVVADFATEAALGVNAGYWDRARVSLQAEMTNGQRNFPAGFLDNVDPERLSVLLQAGARF